MVWSFKKEWDKFIPTTITTALTPKTTLTISHENPHPYHPKQHAFHWDSPYWLNLQPWSAALTIKFCSHFISFNKVKEALRGKTPPASSEAWRRATERKTWEEEERHLWTRKGINFWNHLRYAQTKAPINSADPHLGLVVRIFTWDKVRSQIHKSTRKHANSCKSEMISEKWSVGCPDWKMEVRTPIGRKTWGKTLMCFRELREVHLLHTHTPITLMSGPQWHLEGNSGCIILQLYFSTVWPWLAWKSWSKEEQTGLVIRCKANYYLSNIPHTINISLSISAHLRRSIKGAGILLTKMNAPSSLPPLWPISLEV